jgi:hypothetical protein
MITDYDYDTDTHTLVTIADRVATGAALLDAARPGWRDEVDPEELDITDTVRCVLGQLYGDDNTFGYAVGLSTLGVSDSERAGFACSHTGRGCDGPELTAEWRRTITGR